LNAAVKLAVFEQLGVDFTEVSDGVIKPTFPQPAAAPAAAPVAANPPQAAAGGYGQRPPKVDPKTIPTFNATLNGVVVEVQDLRTFKGPNGPYKPTAADFRVGKQGYWMIGKDGTPDETGQLLRSFADGEATF
jgi:hypothetical protein